MAGLWPGKAMIAAWQVAVKKSLQYLVNAAMRRNLLASLENPEDRAKAPIRCANAFRLCVSGGQTAGQPVLTQSPVSAERAKA